MIDARARTGSIAVIAAVVGVLGLAGWLVGLWMAPRPALHAFLFAWAWCVFTSVAALIFVCTGLAMGSAWVAVLRRLALSLTAALPILAIGAVVVIAFAGDIYVWAGAPTDAHFTATELEQLHHKQAYLNQGGLAIRSAIYFAAWMGIAWRLRGWIRRRADHHARSLPPPPRDGERNFACVALPILGLTLTFAAFDWLMSLEPLWISTMYGIYVFAGSFLSALALLTVLVARCMRRAEWARAFTGGHLHALGRLLLAFVAFWAYCAYFQAMLIQIADLPHEAEHYLRRLQNGWEVVAWILILGHFALPLALLLPRSWKQSPLFMTSIAGWLIVMGIVDVYWLVLPSLPGRSALPTLIDLAALAAVVGASVAVCALRACAQAVLPVGDPQLAAGLAYRSAS